MNIGKLLLMGETITLTSDFLRPEMVIRRGNEQLFQLL
ncbi:MAG: hypothetical protein JWQ14_496 [Adhaeribacter sp.]|jgi:hypothetical protein|nr:hypothetical protein [Adhaeribacter sp.]